MGGAAVEVIRDTRSALRSIKESHSTLLNQALKKLRSIVKNKKVRVEGIDNFLELDCEHIFGMKFPFNKKTGKINLSGFHHDHALAVELGGKFNFAQRIEMRYGCYEAEIYFGEHYLGKKTFFPAHWSREEVVEKIYEACENFAKSGLKPELLQKSNQYRIHSLTNEGIEIEMLVARNGKIITAYPTP